MESLKFFSASFVGSTDPCPVVVHVKPVFEAIVGISVTISKICTWSCLVEAFDKSFVANPLVSQDRLTHTTCCSLGCVRACVCVHGCAWCVWECACVLGWGWCMYGLRRRNDQLQRRQNHTRSTCRFSPQSQSMQSNAFYQIKIVGHEI